MSFFYTNDETSGELTFEMKEDSILIKRLIVSNLIQEDLFIRNVYRIVRVKDDIVISISRFHEVFDLVFDFPDESPILQLSDKSYIDINELIPIGQATQITCVLDVFSSHDELKNRQYRRIWWGGIFPRISQ